MSVLYKLRKITLKFPQLNQPSVIIIMFSMAVKIGLKKRVFFRNRLDIVDFSYLTIQFLLFEMKFTELEEYHVSVFE